MTTDRIVVLEARKELLASRIKRLAEEPDRMSVEGFDYVRKEHAAKVRLALVKALLRNIDTINAEIGKMTEVRV